MSQKQTPSPLQTLLLQYNTTKTDTPQHYRQMFALMNSIAMNYAKEGYLQKALEFLHNSQKYATKKHIIQVKSNLGCVLMKLNRYEDAIQYLKDAEQLIEKQKIGPERDKLHAECCMNLCAILSAIKQHSKALQMIRKALKITRKTVAKYTYQTKIGKKELEPHIIAQYNQAAELEHLNRFEEALWGYEDCKKWLNVLQKQCQTNKCSKLEQKIEGAIKAMKKKVRETKRNHCSRSSCYQIENKHSQQHTAVNNANNGNNRNNRNNANNANNANIMSMRVSLNHKKSVRDEFATLDADMAMYSSVKVNHTSQMNQMNQMSQMNHMSQMNNMSHTNRLIHLNPMRNKLISRASMKSSLESDKGTLHAPLRQTNNPLFPLTNKTPMISMKLNRRYSMERRQKEN